jgi:acyl-CoA thioester hydrolase
MDFPERLTVYSHSITIVPRYAETDKGGVVHHSVYPVWFEMGRTELLRANGLAYKDLEKAGIFFVVVEQENPKYLGFVAKGSSILACVDGKGRIRRIPEFMHPDTDEKSHKNLKREKL